MDESVSSNDTIIGEKEEEGLPPLPKEIIGAILCKRAQYRLMDYLRDGWIHIPKDKMKAEWVEKDIVEEKEKLLKSFCKKLKETGSVITGSATLAAFIGGGNSPSRIHPNDLDIFIPLPHQYYMIDQMALVKFFTSNGWHNSPRENDGGCEYNNLPGVYSSINLCNLSIPIHNKWINITCVNTSQITTIKQWIRASFDIEACKCMFDGEVFEAPSPLLTIRNITRLNMRVSAHVTGFDYNALQDTYTYERHTGELMNISHRKNTDQVAPVYRDAKKQYNESMRYIETISSYNAVLRETIMEYALFLRHILNWIKCSGCKKRHTIRLQLERIIKYKNRGFVFILPRFTTWDTDYQIFHADRHLFRERCNVHGIDNCICFPFMTKK